jgi:hypothetical protein
VRRLLSNLCVATSVLLCIAIGVFWFRSYGSIDWVQWTDHRHFPGVVSSDGRILYTYQFWPNGVGGNTPGLTAGSRPGEEPYWDRDDYWPSRHKLAGFEWSLAAAPPPPTANFGIILPTPATFVAAAPHPFVLLLASLPIVLWIRGWRRRRRAVTGRCAECGYDLRATPGRCPECGKVAA